MTDFSSLFLKSKAKPVEYNGKIMHMAHFLPVKDGDILIISIESTNSDCRQGLCIDITGWCELDGEKHKIGKGIRMHFWEDTAPKEIKLTVHPTNDRVVIYNICERTSVNTFTSDADGKPIMRESKWIDSNNFGAAMIIEEIEKNYFRYRCNDWHPDDNFNDIIFTVKNLGK
jgi:hypothetical protein